MAQGLCLWELNRTPKALSNIDQILEHEEDNSALVNCDTYWLLGGIYETENEPAKEIEAYKKALRYDPSRVEIKITLALALIESEKAEEGLDMLDGVLSDGYEHSFIYNNRALALLKLDSLSEAKQALDTALKLDEDNPFVYYNYYQYYKKIGDDELACENLSSALAKDVLAYGLASDLRLFERLQRKECNK